MKFVLLNHKKWLHDEYEKLDQIWFIKLISKPVLGIAFALFLLCAVVLTAPLMRQRANEHEEALKSYANLISVFLDSYDLTALHSATQETALLKRYKSIVVIDSFGTEVARFGTTEANNTIFETLKLKNIEGQEIGEIRLWEFQSFYDPLTYIFAFLVALGFSIGLHFLVSHFIGRVYQATIILPLKNMQHMIKNPKDYGELSELSSMYMETQISSFEREIRRFLYVYTKLESDLKANKNILKFARTFSEFIFYQDQSSLALTDGKGAKIWSFISENMPKADVEKICAYSATRQPLVRMGQDQNCQILDSVDYGMEQNADACVARLSNGVEVKVERMLDANGYMMTLIKTVPEILWRKQILDNTLRGARLGLTIFGRDGRWVSCVGQDVKLMLPSLSKNQSYGLSDVLAHFPVLEEFDERPSQKLKIIGKSDKVYDVTVQSNRAGRVSIFHQDISEAHFREQQLIESQRLRELGEIASGIAHDFNNALGIIMGQMEIAQISKDHDDSMSALEVALDAAKQASAIVGQLMAYSRNQVLNAKIVGIDALLRKNERVLLSALTTQHKLEFSLKSLGHCHVDPEFLIAAIINLVINARDSMVKPGSVCISTQIAKPAGKNVDYLMISVKDEGGGIPPNVQKKIFDPFFSTKPKGEGNGLGLSMVKGFVEQSQGIIDFETTSAGTDMRIWLPAVEVEKTEERAKLPTPPKRSAPSANINIVMIDDDAAVLLTQAMLLRARGYNVTDFSNPRDAISYIRDHSAEIHLIMVDMQMPQMHGLDVVEEINRFGVQLEIAICSGNLSPDVLDRARSLGVQHYLEKPVSLDAFSSMIENAIDHERVMA